MYLQTEIENSLWSVADALINEPLIRRQCSILEEVLKQYGFSVRPGIKAKNKTTIYAYYDPKAKNLSRQLVLLLGQRKDITTNVITNCTVSKFLFEVNCAVQHELIHKYQWLHRDVETYQHQYAFSKKANTRFNPHKLYLGSLDEIETHSHDAAMEIRYYHPTKIPEEVIGDCFNKAIVTNLPTFKYYITTFGRLGQNPQYDKVYKVLLRKTFLWLPKVFISRPITYKHHS